MLSIHLRFIFTQIFFFSIFLLLSPAAAEEDYKVGIKADLPFISVFHQGKKVTLKRIQDTTHRLSDDFTRTSRACPPFCIWPVIIEPGIIPVGEIEIIDFLENQVKSGKGYLVDARLPSFYNTETIPGSINIPWVLFTNKEKIKKVFKLLGAEERPDKTFDFTNALDLCLFCSGASCGQSPRAIKALYKAGYPAEKIRYYRGGMQSWKLFGFVTILSKDNIITDEVKK